MVKAFDNDFYYQGLINNHQYSQPTFDFPVIKFIEVTDVVNIEQSIEGLQNAFQGYNIPENTNIENTLEYLNNVDLDKRPSLGTWYYNELNQDLQLQLIMQLNDIPLNSKYFETNIHDWNTTQWSYGGQQTTKEESTSFRQSSFS